jgi:hypothetical protein
MLLDFPNGVFGQILVDLGNDTRLDIDVKCATQVGQGLRRRYYHKRRHLSRSQHLLHRGRNLLREPVLFNVMPIDGLDRTPLRGIQRLADASWPLAALLMVQRIVVLEYAFRLEVRKLFVAVIAKKQGLATVSDKHECTVRDFKLGHLLLEGMATAPKRPAPTL